MDLIEAELSEFFVLEFAKIAESDFVYTLAPPARVSVSVS